MTKCAFIRIFVSLHLQSKAKKAKVRKETGASASASTGEEEMIPVSSEKNGMTMP